MLIAGDQPLIRTALRHHLQTDPGIVVVETTIGDRALSAARGHCPHVVLTDLGEPPGNGITFIRRIAHLPAEPRPSIIALATTGSDDQLFEALRAGAVGYLLKNSAPALYTQATRHVMAGHGFIDPQVTRRLISRFTELSPCPPPAPEPHVLTPREREVLRHLAQGLANRAIARALNISEGTVKIHINHILGKLRLASRVEATIYAHRHGTSALGPTWLSGA